jgi:hypothetical protein
MSSSQWWGPDQISLDPSLSFRSDTGSLKDLLQFAVQSLSLTIGILVTVKSVRSDIPYLHLWMRHSTDRFLKGKKGLRILELRAYSSPLAQPQSSDTVTINNQKLKKALLATATQFSMNSICCY